jgi:hypothetical protein
MAYKNKPSIYRIIYDAGMIIDNTSGGQALHKNCRNVFGI